ncbi:MAG TPA: RICIN domain-containing protein [Actinocrinis sp.]|uniref:RICIN domain-containing protein n=1 Tax=Actinocrinis sp. TaxID=1920516 RepID=UPI002DDDA219|nr:RICIN domain-containing protein [Actinocrinis sp.]HEV3173655.1 RICIN domain-containing protein [Actinocrinis sp.]
MKNRAARRITAAILATVAAAATVATTAGTASAIATTDVLNVSYGTTPYWIAASNSVMPVSVADASYDAGHRVIQWYNTGGDEQKWYFDGVTDENTGQYLGFLLRNKRSGMCLDTDGVPGDELFQEPCSPYAYGQIFNNTPNYDVFGIIISWSYSNYDTGLELDVAGVSVSAGANIDLWYPNNQINQNFYLTQTS